jgi:hypothetical protein
MEMILPLLRLIGFLNRAFTALNLVYQAAEVFRSIEDHARQTEAPAQSEKRSGGACLISGQCQRTTQARLPKLG